MWQTVKKPSLCAETLQSLRGGTVSSMPEHWSPSIRCKIMEVASVYNQATSLSIPEPRFYNWQEPRCRTPGFSTPTARQCLVGTVSADRTWQTLAFSPGGQRTGRPTLSLDGSFILISPPGKRHRPDVLASKGGCTSPVAGFRTNRSKR